MEGEQKQRSPKSVQKAESSHILGAGVTGGNLVAISEPVVGLRVTHMAGKDR